MTTLELKLDDELKGFVERQAREGGHESAETYVESLLAIERLRARAERVTNSLMEVIASDPSLREVDAGFWCTVEQQIFSGKSPEP